MKKISLYLIIILSLFATPSCHKEYPSLSNPNKDDLFISSWTEVFESFWNGMNNQYVFWSVDKTNWDNIYVTYKKQFMELDRRFPGFKKETADSEEAFQLFTEITENLIDHHYAFVLKGDKKYQYSPSMARVKSRDYYHEKVTIASFKNCIQKNIDSNRIKNYQSGSTKLSGRDFEIISYNIDNGIIYLYLSNFLLYDLQKKQSEEQQDALNTFKNFIKMIETTVQIKGVIFDVRQNSGGYNIDLEQLLGKIISSPIQLGYTRGKNGLGRLDHSTRAPLYLYPNQSNRSITAPIVVLADINSISMAEITCMAVKELKNGCFIGERTYGAMGSLWDFDYTYAGGFENDYYQVYTSSFITTNIEDKCLESVGITPDIESLFDKEQFENGIDTQLERAIQYIKTGQ